MKKKIFSVLLLALMLLSILPLSVFAGENATVPHKDLSNTTIEYDFENVFYGQFEVKDYKSNRYKDFELIAGTETFVDGFSNFYIYVYNPNQKTINISSEKNTVNFAFYSKTKGDLENDALENDFNKVRLSFVCSHNATTENEDFTNGTILKFKVGDDLLGVESEKETVNRHYKIADIELLIKDNKNPKSFIVGRHYEIMCKDGYTYSYDSDLATLDIEAFHTFYRTKTEDLDTYKDIQSVYFPIPRDYEDIYGPLYSMKIKYTYEMYNPILLCEDSSVVDDFMKQYIDNESEPVLNNENFKWSLVYDKGSWNAEDFALDYWRNCYNLSPLNAYLDWSSFVSLPFSDAGMYNFENIVEMPGFPDVKIRFTENTPPLRLAVQYTGDFSPENLAINGEDLLAEINKVRNDSYFNFTQINYEKEITVDDVGGTFNKYKICSGWENFWNGGFYNKAGDEISIEPFQKIDLEHLNSLDKQTFADTYLVDENDISCSSNECGKCISCATSNEKYKNCDWYLLRYTYTYFNSWDSVLIDNTTGHYYHDKYKTCVVETDVIRDFDTISLSFKEDVEDGTFYSTFPIGRTPTDFVADATFPSEKPNIELPKNYDKFKDIIDKIMTFLKIVIVVFAVIIILRILGFILPIFKPLKEIFKKRKDDDSEKKNN